VLGAIGRVFIAIGLLLFGFAAYQVWGTGIQEARSQSTLEKEFDALTKAAPVEGATTTATSATTIAPSTTSGAPDSAAATTLAQVTTIAPTTTTTEPDPGLKSLLNAKDGDAVAILEIPSIKLKKIVVSGVTIDDLRRGPGHYRNTALPGQRGNVAIAAHRTAYGSPFKQINELKPGDQIFVTNSLKDRFVYKVRDTKIVDPTDTSVLNATEDAILTLTSCHPLYTAQQRIIVTATLDEAATKAPIRPATPLTDKAEIFPIDAPLDPAVTAKPTDTDTDPSTVAPNSDSPSSEPTTTVEKQQDSVDAFSKGWFSDKGAPPQVALWGLGLTGLSLIAWQLSRKTKRNAIGLAVGIVPFLVVLYFFYENVNRLLPPSI
jgi:sortase A